ESFDVTLCTPGWLAERVRHEGIVDGRHHLFIAKYDYDRLERYLRERVSASEGASWDEVASQVAWLGAWEFEDYREGSVAPDLTGLETGDLTVPSSRVRSDRYPWNTADAGESL